MSRLQYLTYPKVAKELGEIKFASKVVKFDRDGKLRSFRLHRREMSNMWINLICGGGNEFTQTP
jgi:hypothetical protein